MRWPTAKVTATARAPSVTPAPTRTFRPMDREQVAAILARSAAAARGGQYELFKSTERFDSTAQHPDWLGPLSARTRQLAPQNAG